MYVDNLLLSTFAETLANKSFVHDPFYFSFIWPIIGILFFIFAISIILVIIYITRKKPIKTLSNLKPATPQKLDINALRNKYLAFISQTEKRFEAHHIKASAAHQELSIIVRLFYTEVSGLHADVLTLNDLKHTNKHKLAHTIEAYYPPEFNQLEQGSVADAATMARNLIMDDEATVRLKTSNNSAPSHGGKK